MAERWMRNTENVYWGMGAGPVMTDPTAWDDLELDPDLQQETRRPVVGWLLPPVASSIWAAMFTKQSNNLLFDMAYRAKAVYEHLRTLWNDFCLWSRERQNPWGVWSCQIGYEDPSEDPAWRMKSTVEVKSWRNMTTVFHIGRTNAKWAWKSSRRLNGKRMVWLKQPEGQKIKVPMVPEPLW
ncbi:hypothetical protein F5Y06DRAFT_299131 [Hypoxylon sp. FL0890]|nr:hypothetical protein F5Y06DRAFT_299131 [Hypoxylon sp. FL0890]